MDLSKSIEEIGILETNIQIEKYFDDNSLIKNISNYIPISTNPFTKNIINNTLNKLLKLNKKNILMLSNEIALIEKMVEYKDFFENIIVVLSRNLRSTQINQIKKNVPKDINVSFIKELEFPTIIKPKDSAIITFGYLSGKSCLVSKNSYRMMEIYKDFLGEKIFISCANENINQRPRNWILINQDKYFTKII